MNNNVIKFTDARGYREAVRDQACAWLVRIDEGASEEDMSRLVQWLEEDPLHVSMLINMAAMWDQAEILAELSEIFPLEEKSVSLRSNPRTGTSWAFAAFAAIMLLGGVLVGWRSLDLWGYHLDEDYETAIGERRQIDLPDGSIVTLNTNTKAHFSFDRRTRTVILDHGEGFFTVAKDKTRPFRVYAGARVVEAVGTAFTVQRNDGKQLEVLVTEGKVNLFELAGAKDESGQPEDHERLPLKQETTADSVIPLAAGERLTIAQEAQKIEREQLQPDEMEVKLAWRVGMLVFQGDSLETVLREVSRYTTVKLEADEGIRNIQIEGLFRAGDIDGLLIAMEKNFNLRSQRIGEDQIRLTAGVQEE
ncbi:MAG TPA: FecR domain-containing protein [Hyphomicrobiales bacterium]|nr:FecR domain-containing protein [Hyphomicrobiales bacterium]